MAFKVSAVNNSSSTYNTLQDIQSHVWKHLLNDNFGFSISQHDFFGKKYHTIMSIKSVTIIVLLFLSFQGRSKSLTSIDSLAPAVKNSVNSGSTAGGDSSNQSTLCPSTASPTLGQVGLLTMALTPPPPGLLEELTPPPPLFPKIQPVQIRTDLKSDKKLLNK